MKKVFNNMFLACAFLLLAAGAAMPLNAAPKAAEKQPVLYYGGQPIEVGDTIRIHKDSLYYLTGERISKWVYTKPHTVQQVGGRRYPYGVLIRGIYSWVYPQTIEPVVPKVKYDTISVVSCDKYYWDATATTYNQSGEYTFNGKAVNGCDSIVTLYLTINKSAATSITRSACGEYYWEATGETYTKSGDYVYTTQAANGCDSIVTLHLTVRQPSVSKTTVEVRPRHLPYEWKGIVMRNIGDTSLVVEGADKYGCDSIYKLQLKFKSMQRWGKKATPIGPGWMPNIPYHIDRFSVGVRGGFATNFAGEKMPLGAGAAIDLGFAHYWVESEGKPALGIKTGLSLGYVYTTQQKQPAPQDYWTAGNKEHYVISVDNVLQNTNQLQLEVPIMFSMQTAKGLFLNAGPKLILPVMSKYHQTLDNPNITAYLPKLDGKEITNDIVMGKVSAEQADYKGNFLVDNPCKLFSLALGAEFGYNIKLPKFGQSIDLGIYADYSIINAYKNTATPTCKVITVTPPSAASIAIVDVQSLSTAYSNQFGYMNVGLKVAFNFDTNYIFN